MYKPQFKTGDRIIRIMWSANELSVGDKVIAGELTNGDLHVIIDDENYLTMFFKPLIRCEAQ